MMRIDAHQHFWKLAARAGSWPPPELAALRRDFLPDDLAPLLQSHGVDGTVLVQSLPTPAETEFLLEVAHAVPFVRGVVGWADLKASDAASQIVALAQDRHIKGLRPMLEDLAHDRWIADPSLDAAVDAMQRCGLVFDAQVSLRHLPALRVFAQRYPQLSIVIDHAARPPIAADAYGSWAAALRQFAILPNVVCKLSGLVTEAGPHWTLADIAPYAALVLAAFGPERVLWGSDWPVLNLASDYAGWIAVTERLLQGFSAQQVEQILGGNALRVYRLDETV